ncbi:MAG: hypothetical protein ACR2PX_18710 [Endozoicomonas sp.]|uniref:hypothetical protein n=1 Tax=Endozoicomonas sp. TaxID=1892382 RepID=UPI003D9B269C
MLPDIAFAQHETADEFPFFKPEANSSASMNVPADCRGVIIDANNRGVTGVIPKRCSKSKTKLSSTLNSFKTTLSENSPVTPVTRISSDENLIYIYTPLDSINEHQMALATSTPINTPDPDALILFGNQLIQGQLICLGGECFVTSTDTDLPSGLIVFTKSLGNQLQLRGTTSADGTITPTSVPITSTSPHSPLASIDSLDEMSGQQKILTLSDFTGAGLSPGGQIMGSLDSNSWSINGIGQQRYAFGSTYESGQQSPIAAGVSQGGMYAMQHQGVTYLWLQSDDRNFTPGTVTLRIRNNTGLEINFLKIESELLIYKDQSPLSIRMSYATISQQSVREPVFKRLEDLSSQPLPIEQLSNTKLTGYTHQPIPVNGDLYIRWYVAPEAPWYSGITYDELGIGPVTLSLPTVPLARQLRAAANEMPDDQGSGITPEPMEPETTTTTTENRMETSTSMVTMVEPTSTGIASSSTPVLPEPSTSVVDADKPTSTEVLEPTSSSMPEPSTSFVDADKPTSTEVLEPTSSSMPEPTSVAMTSSSSLAVASTSTAISTAMAPSSSPVPESTTVAMAPSSSLAPESTRSAMAPSSSPVPESTTVAMAPSSSPAPEPTSAALTSSSSPVPEPTSAAMTSSSSPVTEPTSTAMTSSSSSVTEPTLVAMAPSSSPASTSISDAQMPGSSSFASASISDAQMPASSSLASASTSVAVSPSSTTTPVESASTTQQVAPSPTGTPTPQPPTDGATTNSGVSTTGSSSLFYTMVMTVGGLAINYLSGGLF